MNFAGRLSGGKCVFALLVAVLGGCTSQVRVDSSWQSDQFQDQPFKRVLVVGLSPNASLRCDFESFMTNQLRETAEAKASCLFMKTSESITREAIERAVDEYQPDAVLTTSLVQSGFGTKEGGSEDTRGAAYYKATDAGYADCYLGPASRCGYFGGYGLWGVPVVTVEFETAPTVTSVDGEATILSMLYAVSNSSLIYELTTTARNLKSRDNALASLTGPIASRLRRDGLVPE